MKDKYLPIGSICSLKGMNKKIMIIGFFSVEYNGNVTLFDYCGCNYPEGLLKNKVYSFNHNQIEKVYFVGFKSDEHNSLNNHLLDENDIDNFEKLNSNSILSNFKFDANGVVVFEQVVDSVSNKSDSAIEEKNNVIEEDSKSIFIQNQINQPSHILENVSDSKNWNIFKNIKFDDNGVVVEADEYTPEEIKNMENDNLEEI